MKAARLIRSLPALLVVWLAVLCLQVAQPGMLVHHWEHAREQAAHDTRLHAQDHAGAPEADQHAAAESCNHDDETSSAAHNGACDLCAHFAFLGSLQTGSPGASFADGGESVRLPVVARPTPVRHARERYAARAPPANLS